MRAQKVCITLFALPSTLWAGRQGFTGRFLKKPSGGDALFWLGGLGDQALQSLIVPFAHATSELLPMASALSILHLSDLHFGNKNRFAEKSPELLAQEFHSAMAEAMVSHGGHKVDLVIVSGDFAELGKTQEFEIAQQFLAALAKRLTLPHTRFVLLPGNHDINWGDCKNLRNDLSNGDISEEDFPRLLSIKKLTRYHTFLRNFYDLVKPAPGTEPAEANLATLGNCTPLERGGWLWDFEDLRLSVAALNSSEREDDEKPGGFLSEEQAKSLMEKWKQSGPARLRIIAVHHNPVATTQENEKWTNEAVAAKEKTTGIKADVIRHYISDLVGFDGREGLKRVAKDMDAHLVVHGHHHDAQDTDSWPWRLGDGHCAVLSVGSFGLSDNQLPGDAPLSCQIIQFVTEGPQPRLKAHPLVYDPRHRPQGAIQPGAFRGDLKSDAAYDKPLVLPKDWAPPVLAASAPLSGPSPALRQLYHEQQRKALGFANLGGLYAPGEKDRSDAIELGAIFVEPSLISHKPGLRKEGRAISLARESELESVSTEMRFSASETLFDGPQWIMILGEPGSGKSSLLHWHSLRLLSEWESKPTAPFPVYLRLSIWENSCPRAQSLVEYVASMMEKDLAQGKGAVSSWLAADVPVVWMLDGVDEVRDSRRRSSLLDELTKLQAALPNHRWIVTSRPTGYQRGTLGKEWWELDLAPLDNNQALALLSNWSRLLSVLDKRAVFEADSLFADLADQAGLSRLRRNPLLLTMIVLFYRDSKRLPYHRWEFYEHSARALRNSWVKFRSDRFGAGDEDLVEIIDADWLEPVLAFLAIQAMKVGEVVFTGETLKACVIHALLGRNIKPELAEEHAKAFMHRALKFIGVFVEKGADRFGFLHLTFQEYYAADWLRGHEPEAADLIAEHWNSADWQEVWDLYVLGLKENATKLNALHDAVGRSEPAMASRLRWLGLGSAPFPKDGSRHETLRWGLAALELKDSSSDQSVTALGALSRWERRYPDDIVAALTSFLNGPDNERCHLAAKALGEQTEGRELRAELIKMLCGPDEPAANRLRGFAELALAQKADSPRVQKALQDLYHGLEPEGVLEAPSRLARAAAARALGGIMPAVTLWPVPERSRTIHLGPEADMTFVLIPKGTLVGGDDLKHRVEITHDFWLAQTQVTQAQWEAVTEENPSNFKGAHLPVEGVSWNDIAGDKDDAFNRLLTAHPAFIEAFGADHAAHLPTEAQWEYACRAGTETAFHYGDKLGSDQANLRGTNPHGGALDGVYRERTVAVGSFAPNTWGLHDMHGNVWEWCHDRHADYPAKPGQDYSGPSKGSDRVFRGGGWDYNAVHCQSSIRNRFTPGSRSSSLGFRPAVSSVENQPAR